MKKTARVSSRRHFTLIELLATMAIILVLAGMIFGVASLVSKNIGEAKAKAQIEKIMFAMQEHFQDRGYYPRIEDIDQVAGSYSDAGTVTLSFDYDRYSSPVTFRVFRHGAPTSGPAVPAWETSWPPFHHTQTGQVYMENMPASVMPYDPAGATPVRDVWIFRDSWGSPLRYTTWNSVTAAPVEEGYRVWSLGPDKTSGTADDITSWGKR